VSSPAKLFLKANRQRVSDVLETLILLVQTRSLPGDRFVIN